MNRARWVAMAAAATVITASRGAGAFVGNDPRGRIGDGQGASDPGPDDVTPSGVDPRGVLTRNATPGRVPVVIESTGRALLVQLVVGRESRGWSSHHGGGTVSAWGATTALLLEPLCTTPCALWAIPGSRVTLQVGGIGLRAATSSIAIGPTGNRFRLFATPEGPYLAGTVLSGVGSAVTVVGAFIFALGGGDPRVDSCSGSRCATDAGVYHIGGIGLATALAGVAMLVPGIVLTATSRTGVASSAALDARTGAREIPLSQRLSFDAGPLANGGGYVNGAVVF